MSASIPRHASIVLCPLAFERQRLLRAGIGRLARIDCTGPGAAAIDRWFRRARAMISPRDGAPPFIVLAGTAGGLREDLDAGSAGCIEAVVEPDGAGRWTPPPTGRGTDDRPRLTVTSTDEVVSDHARRRLLRERCGADIVDLESVAFARALSATNWPWAIVRGVSDSATGGLPADASDWVDAAGRTRARSVAAALLRRPGSIGPLLRLRRDTVTALDRVAELLVDCLDGPAPS